MSAPLTQLKYAEKKLSLLIKSIPDFRQSLDHQLHTYFYPRLPANISAEKIYITYEAPLEPAQTPRLVSDSLSELIKRRYVSGHNYTYDPSSTKVYSRDYTLDEQYLVHALSIVQIEEFMRHTLNNLESTVTTALEHFWITPRSNLENKAPKDWLSAFLRALITTETELRHTDRTLSTFGYNAIKQVLAHSTFQARLESGASHPLSVYCIALKGFVSALDAPLQGLLVIVNRTHSNLSDPALDFSRVTKPSPLEDQHKAVLYIPGSGLEEFDSLHALSLELESRLQDEYQRKALLDYTLLKDRERAQHLFGIGYREITADVFDIYTAELMDNQKQNIAHACKITKEPNTPNNFAALTTQIERALSITLNPANILQARYTRLLESQLPTWLTTAPEESKQQWRQSVERLRNEMRISQTSELKFLQGNGGKTTLLGYARSRLKKKIKADHSINVDPDQIFISTTQAYNTAPGFNPLSTSGYAAGVSVHRTGSTITQSTTRRSLSQLALENVGLLDLNFALTARVQSADGKSHPVLTADYVKTLVRTLDIGNSYNNLLHITLIDPYSTQVQWRTDRFITVTTAQLRLDILEAKLSGILSSEEASRVEVILSHPVENTRPEINGKQIKAYFLTLRDKPMLGVFVVAAYNSASLICYTPNAPDNVHFRKADSLDNLAVVLSNKLLHSYVLERVSSATQPYVRHQLKQGVSFLGAGLQQVTQHFLQAYYDESAAFVIRNADEQSTSTFEANVQTAKDVALAVIDVISFALPVKILLPLTLARFIYSLSSGFDALARDEKNEATSHFLESVSHLTDGASDLAGSIAFGQTIRNRPHTPALALSPKAASTHPKTNMRLRDNDEYGVGIYEYTSASDGLTRYYLLDEHGNVYRSQYDNLNETWRIIDERQPNALYNMPVYHLSAGRWGVSSTPADVMSLRELIEKASVNVNLNGHTPDIKGIYKINNFSYIRQGEAVFEVQYGWMGHHLYLIMPGTSRSSQNTYKVRTNSDLGYWEVKRRSVVLTKQWEPLSLSPIRQTTLPRNAPHIIYTHYDAGVEHVEVLREITANKEINFSREVYYFSSKWEAARIHIMDIQNTIFRDALIFLKNHSPTPRITPPTMPEHASQEAILKTLHDHYPGIVIAEAHNETASKKFIMENMAYLAKSKVKVLYMEHLQTDLHQRFLDIFLRTGTMPPELDEFLRHLNAGHRIDKKIPYNYRSLVHIAQRHGIQVKALDCVASYNSKGLSNPDSVSPRHEMLSYGAHQIIHEYTATQGWHKWIALVGNTHANRYKGVPGLAELEGSVGLRIEDVSSGEGQGIRLDKGFIDYRSMLNNKTSLLKNDWVLKIETPNKAPRPPMLTNTQLLEKLTEVGMYTFENFPLLGPFLVYRSNNDLLVKTPFIFDTDDAFHINMPNRPLVHQKKYTALHDMFIDLASIGMKRG